MGEGTTPGIKTVPVMGGAHRVTVQKWRMGIREELRPLLADLMAKVVQLHGTSFANFDVQELFLTAEEELTHICRRSVALPTGLEWDDIWWEDLPVMVQAVFEVCVLSADGSGIAGKLAGALGSLIKAGSALAEQAPSTTSSTASNSTSSSRGSASSLDGGVDPHRL